jgi:hypothetical protein
MNQLTFLITILLHLILKTVYLKKFIQVFFKKKKGYTVNDNYKKLTVIKGSRNKIETCFHRK